MEKVLIVGISGGQGRLLARRLRERHSVVGLDRHAWPAKPPGLTFYEADLRKRAFEDVLRKEQPTAVVHLGLQRHFRDSDQDRHDVNVRGTRRLLDHCRTYGVRKLIVLSSSYVYGAFAENPYFMREEHPLSASRNYPEIRDLVEVDTMATAFTWQYPDIQTSVLRPVPTLGNTVTSSIGTYLSMRRVIVMTGFNPMVQFIHEDDLTEAIATALETGVRGVFNVVGPGEVPLRVAIRETGGSALPIPEPLARPLLARLHAAGLFAFPPSAVEYLKYPCTISGERFVEATHFRPLMGLKETFRSVRAGRATRR
jgi:UDP-glucose 4-epimerase